MKKFSLAKILSLVFVCVMLVGALAITAFATEEEKVEILAANVYYGDYYKIAVAVNAPEGAVVTATNSEGVEIDVIPFADQPTVDYEGVTCKNYILASGVAAQAIDEVFTFTVTYGDKVATKNVSVLQYVYLRSQMLEEGNAELEMLQALLAYAIKADIFLDGATSSFDTYQYVSVTGATVNGVIPTGMYAAGSTPFANLDAIEYDAENYELVITVNGETKTLDELKALTVVDSAITVVVSLAEVEKEPELGSEEAPIMVTFNNQSATVTVPANKTYYFQAYGLSNEVTLNANGASIEFEPAANPRMPASFTITNETAADVEYSLELVYPVGNTNNPAELVIGDNAANVSAGSQGYYFTYTVPANGTLTLTIATDATGWSYVVNNMTTYAYGDTQWSDSDPVVNPAVVTVAEGDIIQIIVNTYNPEDSWNTPEGTVTVNAAFAHEHNDTDGDYKCDFDGCTEVLLPEADSVLTIEQVLKLGALYEHNTYTENKYYVSGTVKNVYNTTFGNMYITNGTDELCIYGTYSADGNTRYDALDVKPVVGDTVTIYGIIGTYNSTVQIKNGWITEHTVHQCVYSDATCTELAKCELCGAETGELAEHNYVDGVCSACGVESHTHADNDGDFVCDADNCEVTILPVADATLTIEQAIKLGQIDESGAYTTDKYYVTGVIDNVYNTTYGNMYITDGTNTFCIYGTHSADGSVRYDALDVKPVVGDTVTVYGIIGAYNGVSQMKNGWITAHTVHTCGGDEATCTTAQICTICGATLTEKLGHEIDANGNCTRENCDYAETGEVTEQTYSYEFTQKTFSANGTQNLGDVNWTLAGDGEYWGYDSNNVKGQQFGSSSKPYKTLTLTSDNFNNVTKIVINTSGASSIAGSFTVTVGGQQVGDTITLTKTATDYTFEIPEGATGPIVLTYNQTSSKAIYIKSIEVVYAE